MSADPALDPATASLRLNGYFLITEQELHVQEAAGYRALTDIDIIARRPPTATGPAHRHLGQRVGTCPVGVDRPGFDVVIGEVGDR